MSDEPDFPDHKKRKPDILCIGAQKSGTSWLNEMLALRSDIWVPPFKEQHFFDHKFVPENRHWTGDHIAYRIKVFRRDHAAQYERMPAELAEYLDRVGSKPMFNGQWYQYVFSPAPRKSLCMDVTPEYSTLPAEGVEFVAKFLPRAKFIYLIRHPVKRAMSQLRMNISRFGNTPDTDEKWLQAMRHPDITQRGDYAQYVPRWESHFGKDRLLILPYGRIASEPVALMRDVEAFIGLDAGEYALADQKIGKSKPIKLPPMVEEYFTETLGAQVDFLRDHFGQAFLDQTV